MFWCGQASFFLVLSLYLQLGRGLSALQALDVRHRNAREVPFLIVSRFLSEEATQSVLGAGADDWVCKDDLRVLGSRVAERLATRRRVEGRP